MSLQASVYRQSQMARKLMRIEAAVAQQVTEMEMVRQKVFSLEQNQLTLKSKWVTDLQDTSTQ